MEIKDLIKQRRLEKGYSLEDVAKRVGVSRQTVQKWETGKIENMRRSSVAALSSALGIPIEALMGWDAPEDPDLFTMEKKKNTPLPSACANCSTTTASARPIWRHAPASANPACPTT